GGLALPRGQPGPLRSPATPAGASPAQTGATLAGPGPRSNPRKRDQGLEKPSLFAAVRFAPHARSAQPLPGAPLDGNGRSWESRPLRAILHPLQKAHQTAPFPWSSKRRTTFRSPFARSAKIMCPPRRLPLLVRLAALVAVVQALALQPVPAQDLAAAPERAT